MKTLAPLLGPLFVLCFALPVAASATPSTAAPEGIAPAEARQSATDLILGAIERGVPKFNNGDHEGCARVYEATARTILGMSDDDLSRLNRHELETALAKPADDEAARAWNLRNGFDSVLENERFEPRMEAPLPEGFPGPGPLGRVIVKQYPRYRAARADGIGSFWTLFRHINRNDVQMTTPVEMTMSDEMGEVDMAFLYEGPDQGQAGTDGSVRVQDLEPMTVLSVGMRGRRSQGATRLARSWIEETMEREGWTSAGPWRLFGYNSPMVAASKSYWELQVPVRRNR